MTSQDTTQHTEPAFTVTDDALDHLRALIAEYPEEKVDGLRIFIQKGGCAGLQYGMKLDNRQPGDSVVERAGIAVMVDPESLSSVKGCQIDYVDNLNDAGFKITNPNATRSCGCGTSFETQESPAADPNAGCE